MVSFSYVWGLNVKSPGDSDTIRTRHGYAEELSIERLSAYRHARYRGMTLGNFTSWESSKYAFIAWFLRTALLTIFHCWFWYAWGWMALVALWSCAIL